MALELDDETMVEIAVSVGSVILMIATLAVVGASYSTDGDLSREGGQVMVGVIVLFIVLMFVIGFWLSRYKN